jgi:hypothetical protein
MATIETDYDAAALFDRHGGRCVGDDVWGMNFARFENDAIVEVRAMPVMVKRA